MTTKVPGGPVVTKVLQQPLLVATVAGVLTGLYVFGAHAEPASPKRKRRAVPDPVQG